MKRILAAAALAACFAPPAYAQAGERAIERLREADANRDQRVTRQEFLAYRAGQFPRLDRNHDGLLSQADAPPFAGLAPASMQPGALIAQFDANRDGVVSRTEFVNGPTAAFNRADANRDNVVTEGEIRAAAAAARARR